MESHANPLSLSRSEHCCWNDQIIIWEDESSLQGSCSCSIIQLDVRVRHLLPQEATGSWLRAPVCTHSPLEQPSNVAKCVKWLCRGVRWSDCRTVPTQQVAHPFALIGNDATRRWRHHGKVASVNNWCNIPQNHFWFHPAQPLVIRYMGAIRRLEVRHPPGGPPAWGTDAGIPDESCGVPVNTKRQQLPESLPSHLITLQIVDTEEGFKFIWEAMWSAAMQSLGALIVQTTKLKASCTTKPTNQRKIISSKTWKQDGNVVNFCWRILPLSKSWDFCFHHFKYLFYFCLVTCECFNMTWWQGAGC